MTNSVDPDHLASEANWSESTLFAKTGHVVFSKRRVKFADWLKLIGQMKDSWENYNKLGILKAV